MNVRSGHTINSWPAHAIGAPWALRPVRSIGSVGAIWTVRAIWPVWPARTIRAIWPVWSIGPLRPLRPVRAPWPVRPPGSIGPVVTVPPMMVAPGPVAIIVRVDACAERCRAKDQRQRACEPFHVCSVLAVSPRGSVCPASIAPALRLVRMNRGTRQLRKASATAPPS